MSINHYTSEPPHNNWWSHYTMELPPAAKIITPPLKIEGEINVTNLYNKEPLFEKPLTPSDVGKLNRLVIPKQHAEKYFPLSSAGAGADSGEKGFLLGFEDELGKSWRFRYSYWNSSQSYVLTKGWSRFVKEKRLDAGDFVVFLRHREDVGRLFIGWRRRSSGQEGGGGAPVAVVSGGGDIWNHRVSYPSGQGYEGSPSSPYQPECLHAGSVSLHQSPTPTSSGNSKRLRLFGVNLECEVEPELGSPVSSQGQAYIYPHQQHYSNGHNHTGMYYSGGDVYRQR